jgi:hypothetical protein
MKKNASSGTMNILINYSENEQTIIKKNVTPDFAWGFLKLVKELGSMTIDGEFFDYNYAEVSWDSNYQADMYIDLKPRV